MNDPVLMAWSSPEGEHISLATALLLMLTIGIGTAAVFFGILAPLLGEEKVRVVFDHSQDLNKILEAIQEKKPAGKPGSLAAVCGNRTCEPGETVSTCLQDCSSCNGNGKCETAAGENHRSCLPDCP